MTTTTRTSLVGLDVEAVRFSLERQLAAALDGFPGFAVQRASLVPRDAEAIRRRLHADALALSPTMAPAAHAQAEAARATLAIDGALELYQSSGRENAALHFVQSPILLEIQGRMLTLLDDGAAVALFGHELGHWLAHGPWTELGATALAGLQLAEAGVLPSAQAEAARRLAVAREITADRFGLLACQDLDAALRLEMIATTGLPGDALTWDTAAYLEQARELMDRTLAAGEAALATTHPEHSLRAWALWLFSESDVYQRLTGRGASTRSLAEVDAVIARALGSSRVDVDFDARDEPPAFLGECALACAVLVAAADGVISPEELDAIEDAFGRTIPGWSELLDPEVALARFYETGGMVRAGGSDLVRSLFLLLTHVMGADDVVDAREVQTILAIGEALGHGGEFRRWIRPAIAAMQSPLELELLEQVAIPLPVRKHEVADALAALCDSVERRGESSIAPRRLLRLAGVQATTPEALAPLAQLFRDRGIEVSPALHGAPLDQPVRLVATRRPPSPAAAPIDASRRALTDAITRLRDELISGDGRSPSVRLRRLVRGRCFDLIALDAIRPGTAERTLTLVRGGREAVLVTADDAGRHDAAEACSAQLRELHREVRDRIEETGANELYVGYPVLVGNIAPRGVTEVGYGVRAPLVLFPVELERDGRGARGFSLRRRSDEEPIANQSLLRLLFNKAALAFPDELGRELDDIVADPARGVEAMLAKLREIGVPVAVESTALVPFGDRDRDLDEAPPRLSIEECALLGLFPQSSSDLLQDYDALLRELADLAKEPATVLASAAALLPATTGVVGEPAVTDAGAPGWPVVAADPSQRAVLAQCRSHRVTVVDGPPGTGKSQLIVNLVADALRRGERVAVVAEKRAALDVVGQRLEVRGLGQYLAVVHDVHEDRKPLFERVRVRLEAKRPSAPPPGRLELLRMEYEQAKAALEADRDVLAQRIDDAGLCVGQLITMVAGGETHVVDPALAGIDRERLRRLLELVERLHPHQDLWAPSAWWRQRGLARGSLRGYDDAALTAMRVQLRDAIAHAEAFDAALAPAPVDRDALARAREGLLALHAARAACQGPDDIALLTALCLHGDDGVASLVERWRGESQALAQWSPGGLVVDDPAERAVTVLQSFAGRWTRIVSPLWWRTRAEVRASLVRLWPEQAAAGFDAEFLARLQSRLHAARAWAQARALFERLGLSARAQGDAASAGAAIERLQLLAGLAAPVRAAATTLAAIGISLERAATDEWAAHRLAQSEAQQRLLQAVAAIAGVFPWVLRDDATALRELADRLARDATRLRELDGWTALACETMAAAPALLDRVAAALAGRPFTDWRESIARAWAAAQLERARNLQPRIDDLGTIATAQRADRAIETMTRLEPEIAALEVAAIVARVDQAELLQTPNAGYRARRTDPQRAKESLLKEVGKKSRLMPLRRFVREFADVGLLDVMPCWLLSPETMTVLFPREPLFDLVIFDEASQCTVESGLPVMLRAQRVVIAGDEKQMPPSSYFELGTSSTDDEDRSAEELAVRDVFAAESLLALARARCPHAGLQWHYRCRDESLIAFSNHAMYDGELLTIPSTHGPTAPPALRWIAVEGGQYDAGLNRPEAERVVALIAELLSRSEPPTIGVVTFNLRQRQTVLDAVEARVAADDGFAAAWRAATTVDAIDRRPFVKNLESVQGDERDVIVFSLGHAPVERTRKGGASERYVPARFGPLGQRGGERRLNVAISRAKAECYVVASFDPELLHVGDATHDGPRLFKAYLEFAFLLGKGQRLQAQQVLDDVRGRRRNAAGERERASFEGHVPLAVQIALALERTGLRCELGLGASEFRIPLAIGAADTPDFALAVLTDEGADAADAFERHLHRPAVLRLRGWDVMHVDAATWSRRRADVVAEIERRATRRR